MHAKKLYSVVLLCLVLALPAMLPGICTANQENDAAAFEKLMGKKAALDKEGAQLDQEFLEIIHRGKVQRLTRAIKRVDRDLQAHAHRLLAYMKQRRIFDQEWYKCHPKLKGSPEFEKFQTRRASLDSARTAFIERYKHIIREHLAPVGIRRRIQYFKKDLRKLEEEFLAYQKDREAFENEWGAFCEVKR